VEEHQVFQRKISETQREIERKDQVIARLASELKEVEMVLEQVVDDVKVKLQLIHQANRSKVSVNDIVSYSKHISFTTSAAPSGWEEREQLVIFRPPHPSEEQLRASLLHSLAALTAPPPLLPPPQTATGSVSPSPSSSTTNDVPASLSSSKTTSEPPRVYMSSSAIFPQLPEGWKIGDPIDPSVVAAFAQMPPERMAELMLLMGMPAPPPDPNIQKSQLPASLPPPSQQPTRPTSSQPPPRPVLTGLDFESDEDDDEDSGSDDDDL
jgi:hypothetical protein